jgi:hypothetical protein
MKHHAKLPWTQVDICMQAKGSCIWRRTPVVGKSDFGELYCCKQFSQTSQKFTDENTTKIVNKSKRNPKILKKKSTTFFMNKKR